MTERGTKLDADFRYLTENYGSGRIWGGFLANDKQYNNDERSDLHFLHNWEIDEQWGTNLEFNQASDKDYFSDFNHSPNTKTDLNLRRAWELNYQHGIPGLKAQFKVEDFQTLDKTIKDADKPYARLPQFLLNYKLIRYRLFAPIFHTQSILRPSKNLTNGILIYLPNMQ